MPDLAPGRDPVVILGRWLSPEDQFALPCGRYEPELSTAVQKPHLSHFLILVGQSVKQASAL
jgi:hypothetical protein